MRDSGKPADVIPRTASPQTRINLLHGQQQLRLTIRTREEK